MAKLEARKRRIGSLDVLHVEASDDGPTVILFHGFGADMADLAPLAGVVQAPKGTNWVFPNGHLKVPLGGHFEGHAWFPISVAELERSMATGDAIDWSTLVPPGLKKARELAFGLIEKLGVPHDRLVLGGFSQGGMLATDVMLHMDRPPAGLAVLSGTLVNAAEWEKLAAKFPGFYYFLSHGSRDPVLNIAMAERLERLLAAAGWQGKLQRFDGAHEIPSEVLIQLGAYLRRCTSR